MVEINRETRILVDHFFRRFFDNDTIQPDGDTLTTVIRAASIVAVPGLMVAFWLQTQYPGRTTWAAISDHYFFILFSFVVMGLVSILEWEMLFPDRLDFLILSPLPLKRIQLLVAKAAALIGFLSLFLVSCNLFGALTLSAVNKGGFFRQVYAHGVAVVSAGVFAALLFLAVGGVLLCVLDAARFRLISPVIQMLSVTVLALLMIHYIEYGNAMQELLAEPMGMVRWVPTVWFLGVYEQLLHGDAAPAFAKEMTKYALRGVGSAAVVVLLTYPMAWVRMRRSAMEGSSRGRRESLRWLGLLVQRVVRRPAERAVFHFIGQTMARNNRYQVYLAMYCGTGLAIVVACAVSLHVSDGGVQPVLSARGLHAMMPLLLFWLIAGLRTAFGFPLNLSAGWIFRVTGVKVSECAYAARRWVFFCAVGVMCCLLGVLRGAGWSVRQLLVQAVCGLCLSLLVTEGLFFFQESVPFNRPRMPGRTSLPLMLTLYVGVLPPFVLWLVDFEVMLETHVTRLGVVLVTTGVIYAVLGLLRGPVEIEEEMEGYEGEFQLLGLS